MEQFFDTAGAGPQQRLLHARIMLEDLALTWWKKQSKEGTQATTWIAFKRELITQFQTYGESQKARNKLYQLRQTSSVKQYIADFDTWSMQISDLQAPEAFHRFKDGLKTEIYTELLRRQIPDNINLWKEQAQQYDELLFSQRTNHRTDFKKPNGPFIKKRVYEVKKDETRKYTCYNCGKEGHMAKECKKPKKPWKKTEDKSKVSTIDLSLISVKALKIGSDVSLPAHATDGSAGLDIKPNQDFEIPPGRTKRVTTGIALEIPKDHFVQIHARSSIFLQGLLITGVIDQDYREGIDLMIRNQSGSPVTYKAKHGKPLAQLIFIPYAKVELKEVKYLAPSGRKGGFGSTNFNGIAASPGKIQFQGEYNGKSKTTLIDSGAEGNFGPPSLAKKIGYKPYKLPNPQTITVADGKDYTITHGLRKVPYNFQGFKSTIDLMILPVEHPCVILGSPWLHDVNPHINWTNKTMTIQQGASAFTIESEGHQNKTSSIKANFIMMKTTQQIEEVIQEGDSLYLITQKDLDEALEITDDFYEKDREEVKDPQLLKLLDEYSDIFAEKLTKPSKCNVEHYITLKPNAKPIQAKQFRLSPVHQKIIEETVQELLQHGHIEPCRSPHRSNLIVVIKKDGKPRVVIDYRPVNAASEDQAYQMKNSYEMLEKAAGHKKITTLDATSGYHHVRMAPNSKPLTAFSVPGAKGGQYQFTVMPFGLKGAPATFQQFMDDVFREYLGDFVVIYIDDIAIFSDSDEEHITHLRKIFQTMRENNIFAKKSKCFFGQSRAPYLGHYISEKGIEMDQKKILTMINWPEIKTLKQLRGFLGLTGYYRRYIQGYAQIALPLTKLLKEDIPFKWTEEQEEAKQLLLKALTEAPILQPPNEKLPYTVTTDASLQAAGAVLHQEGKPVAYLSKTFSAQQKNWTIYEKEMWAIIYALRQWECYLLNGHKVTIITDNNAITTITSQKQISPKQARWIEYLSIFNYEIIHRPGVDNKVADAISRMDIYGITIIEDQHWLERIRALSAKVTPPAFLTERNGLYYKEDRLYIPGYNDVKMKIIQEFHDHKAGHFGFRKTLHKVTQSYFWDKMANSIKEFIRTCDICQRIKTPRMKTLGLLQPIPPPPTKFHTYSLDFIGPFQPTKRGHTGILVIVDMLTKGVTIAPIKMTDSAKEIAWVFYLKIITHFGCPQKIISDRDPRFTGKFWQELFHLIGTKLSFSTAYHPQSDGQTERANQTLETVIRSQINGSHDNWDLLLAGAEYAINSTVNISTGFTPFHLTYGIDPKMPIELVTRDSQNPEAQVTAEQMTEMIDQARKQIIKSQEAQKIQADKHRRDHSFKIGDQVLLSTRNLNLPMKFSKKFSPRFIGPYTILKQIGQVSFLLDMKNTNWNMHPVFHVDRLIPYHKNDHEIFPNRSQEPPPPIQIEDHAEYEVDEILAERTHYRKKQYLVKWQGYHQDDSTWEPIDNLSHAQDKIKDFQSKQHDNLGLLWLNQIRLSHIGNLATVGHYRYKRGDGRHGIPTSNHSENSKHPTLYTMLFTTEKHQPYNRQYRSEPPKWQPKPRTFHQDRHLNKIKNRHHERFVDVYSAGHKEELLGTYDEENNTCLFYRPGMMILVQTHMDCICAMCNKTIQELRKKEEQEYAKQKQPEEDLFWNRPPPPHHTQPTGNNEWGRFDEVEWEKPITSKPEAPKQAPKRLCTKEEHTKACVEISNEIEMMNPIWEGIIHHFDEVKKTKQIYNRYQRLTRAQELLQEVFSGNTKASTAAWEWTLYLGKCKHNFPVHHAETACPSCDSERAQLDSKIYR